MVWGLPFVGRGKREQRHGSRQGRPPRRRRPGFERLEDRRLLAAFSESGTTLELVLGTAESLSILSTAANTYTFTLDGGTWSGTDSANVTGNTTSQLTVTEVGKAALETIRVSDSGAAAGVVFADSGSNAYSDSFQIALSQSPLGTVTFNGSSHFGGSPLTVSTRAPLLVSSGASVTTEGGEIVLNASASLFQNAGTVSAGAGSLTITADSIDLQNALTAEGGITLQPATASRTIGLNDSTGAFNLTAEELGYLVSSGTVAIGAATGVGEVRIGGAGAINLATKQFDLALRGGDVTFASRLQLPTANQLTLHTGAVTSAPTGSLDIQVGTLSLATTGPVGAANNPLAVDLVDVRGNVNGDLFLTELNQLDIDQPLNTSGDHTIHLLGGQFILGADERIGDGSRVNVNGGTLNLGGWNDTVRGVTLTGGQITGSGVLTSLTTFQVQNGTISAQLGGAVGLNKTATGTVTLSAANPYTGTTVIEAGGVLRINQDACLGRPRDGSAPGRLELYGRLEATATLELAADREILLGDPSGTMAVPLNRTLTVQGRMVGGGLIKRGLGTLVLAGDNSFSGGVEYADQSVIRLDHPNGFGTGLIRFSSSGTLQYGSGITKDLSGQIGPWAPSIRVTINTGSNQVVFASLLGHAGQAEPVPASGSLFKTGSGKLTLAPTDATARTRLELLYVEEGEFAVARGTLELLGSATPEASVYTGATSLFVKNATLTVAGGTVRTTESLLLNYGVGSTTAVLNVTGGRLEVPGDLVAGANRTATVHIGGDATAEVFVEGDFLVGLKGSSTVQVSGGTTRILGDLVAGQDGSGTINVSGGSVTATSLRHEGGDDGLVNLTGGIVQVGEVVHQTALNASNDTLTVYLGAVSQDVRGTLITARMYQDDADTTNDRFFLLFDGGTLVSEADGNLIDDPSGKAGLLIWVDGAGAFQAAAYIQIPDGITANVLSPLLHDPRLAATRDGGLTKQGGGTLTLWGDNTFTGPVIVQEGTLALVNEASSNTIAQAPFIDVQGGAVLEVTELNNTAVEPNVLGTLVLADGQTLKGTGTVRGDLIAAAGSTVSPGGSNLPVGSDPGVLTQDGVFRMDEQSVLEIQIGGSQPGNGVGYHDQMRVTGEVSLGDATLTLEAFATASGGLYVPTASDRFIIINNLGPNPVSGIFTGLPEGTVFPDFLGSGIDFRISYVGGDGNDVELAPFQLPRPPILVLGPDKNPGAPQRFQVVAGDSGEVLWQYAAYGDTYVGGTRVALADLDGDGDDEVITAPGRNHPPLIRIFGSGGETVPGFVDFLAYDPAFVNGVQLAVGYVNDDRLPDLITVPSYGMADVRVFLNQYDPTDQPPATPAFDADHYLAFQAFPLGAIGGAVVAAGDLGRFQDGQFVSEPDGQAEVVVGTGEGVLATVWVFDVSSTPPVPVATFYPFASTSGFLGGVSLDVAIIEPDSAPAVIVGMGANGTSRIEVWTWDSATAGLALLGAIPKAFTGASSNASISVAASDTDGDGIADAVFAVQGPVGTTGEIHRFDIRVDRTQDPPLSYSQAPGLGGFPGPWFLATSQTDPAKLFREPAATSSSPTASVWTNMVNPLDVNADGRVTPLDALETINFINVRGGETALLDQQSVSPRYFDTNQDGALTPADVLIVLNHLNLATSAGEGERPQSAVAPGLPPAASVGAGFAADPAAAAGRRGRIFAGLGTPPLSDAGRPRSVLDERAGHAIHPRESRLAETASFQWDAALEDLLAEPLHEVTRARGASEWDPY